MAFYSKILLITGLCATLQVAGAAKSTAQAPAIAAAALGVHFAGAWETHVAPKKPVVKLTPAQEKAYRKAQRLYLASLAEQAEEFDRNYYAQPQSPGTMFSTPLADEKKTTAHTHEDDKKRS